MTEPRKTYRVLPVGGVMPPTAGPRPAMSPGLGERRMQTAPPTEALRLHLRTRLAEQLTQRLRADEEAGRPPVPDADRMALAGKILGEAAEEYTRTLLAGGREALAADVEQAVITTVLNEVFGAAGLEPLLRDPRIENINVTGDRVFVRYDDGRRERLPPVIGSDAELVQLIRDLAARSGIEERRFDRASPGVSFQLPGGERAFAVMALTRRPSLSIRRHRFQHATLTQLRHSGTFDPGLESFLAALVRARKNILITGGTGIGKTTMLRALAAEIPSWERLVTVEDVFELGLDTDERAHPDVVAMQAREANIEGRGEVSAADLVRWALRMSPDRVIVGEVRGPEVIPMCTAMSQGNDGSMGTLHASSSRGAFTKLAAYAVQGPERLSLEATNLLVASSVDFVVHLDRPRGLPGKRVVSSVREIVDADDRQIVSNEVFRPGPDLCAIPGVPLRTETLEDLVAVGFDPARTDPPAWRRA
ncbi:MULTISPECIES: CpaF family protein [unclassified Streptomyces]|uniref:CpaF family protein n=1 Tax=unclassified Streptomyces TaxID=2593676 RepID=UPI000DD79253|nr:MULTISPECIES: ATPase, T2SS/T4P/T4SS family [unclassified Streptomyces]QZZ25560.1 CpaF family protein [Streptomyces sp. ST1015]